MNVNRTQLLAVLAKAKVGLTGREILEQSHAYVFAKGTLTTFNDNILFRCPSPLQIDGAIPAVDFFEILEKLPDEELEITVNGGEIHLEGKRREAAMSYMPEVRLPIDSVPRPESWSRLDDKTPHAMQQAALVCGEDFTAPLTTMIHATPNLIEGSDNFRMVRHTAPTGFPGEVLIPANIVEQLDKQELRKVSIGKGWVHFKCPGDCVISCRCSHEPYAKGVDALLRMEAPEKILLPSNLGEIVERAEVFNALSFDAKVTITLADGELTLTSRKESGWFKEKKSVKYDGQPLTFDVHPKFLVEILGRGRECQVDRRKIKIEQGEIQFVAALTVREKGAK
jgi:DNA polymerase III sliding clamp (beta) subunit (PCNA family)